MFNFLFQNNLLIRYAKRSPRWSTVRKEHLSQNSECAACGSTKDLEVHHIIPVHIDQDKELDPSNLITLCSKQCHFIFGHLMNYKSWNKDVIEDCRVYYNKIQSRPHK
jgi:5-methylcytosine-specific restriction endonuclease McrA